MKFRSGNDGEVRVATTAGHVAMVGPEWRELPEPLQSAALIAGCECDKGAVKAAPHITHPSKDAVDQGDEKAHATKAIKALLKRNDEADFTVDGIPKVPAVSKEAGFTVTKGVVLEVWAELNASE